MDTVKRGDTVEFKYDVESCGTILGIRDWQGRYVTTTTIGDDCKALDFDNILIIEYHPGNGPSVTIEKRAERCWK